MRILFYLGHPAHFHLFKNVISELKGRDHKVFLLIKKKDILENLVARSGLEFRNILPKGRKDSKAGIAIGLLKRNWSMFRYCLKQRPDILLGTSVEISHVGKVLNRPSIVVNEDDYDAVPLFSKLGYPFAKNILAPASCLTGERGGSWERKTVHYEGYHELAYLQPSNFEPNKYVLGSEIEFSKPYAILRFSKLNAHHDKGKTGITTEIARNIIALLETKYSIYITSERELELEFEPHRITIDPVDMHHAIYYASLYIGDSQTMAAEAAVLGTPAVRFNDFVGRLGYLEELEHRYGLTFGIKTSEPERLYQKIKELLGMSNLKEEWARRRQKMLSEKIDVTAFMVWFIERYPESVKVMRESPEYQYRFRSADWEDLKAQR
jgi:predicted glycosyltransferase